MSGLGRLLADPTLYGPESRIGPAAPAVDWPALLARPPEPGEGCDCRWCSAAPVEPVPDLPADHRETD